MPEFITIPLSQLVLDRKNPRLPARLIGAGQDELLRYLIQRTNITELVTSIGENGFFQGEAIIVTKSDESDDEFIVLEGNRRVTALKLIHNPLLADGISKSACIAATQAENRPSSIPAYEVDRREDVLQYLGFRHVSGIQRWGSLAKARYLKMLYDHAQGQPESRYTQIASEIGSRRDTVQKNLDALAVYNMIEQARFFDIRDLDEDKFQFGVFYTALSNTRIAAFAGARDVDSKPTHPIECPVSLRLGPIEELVRWMFEKESSGDTRLGESRNIPMLAAVLSAPDALELLRQGASLKDAFKKTPDIRSDFVREVKLATAHLRLANANLQFVSASDTEVQRTISVLVNEIQPIAGQFKLEL
ncbi:MAG: chromosome partitioning protein ParB [Caldilineaceae bacterium SB0662_bin_9]|uniref:Chromosome partitioning protein ParB n=1 Tax=Caldilineaceae bacterium SB0662_bin_9 TaxID=2605258 RepID=A0A6B1DNR2_9CHLR|nr:chromosome partitioning protein ParB [Caldilineaceae bacterium SB0662_bin_9]